MGNLMFESSRVQQFTCKLSQHPTHIYFECIKRDMVKNALGSSVFYFQVLRTSADPHNNLLHLLKQPIFDKIDLLHSINDTTKESDFYRTRVCMTLINCTLLPMVIIARCRQKLTMLGTDILAWLCESISISHTERTIK